MYCLEQNRDLVFLNKNMDINIVSAAEYHSSTTVVTLPVVFIGTGNTVSCVLMRHTF